MAWNNVKKMAALTAAAAWMTAGQAFAADVTDVLDAADEVYLGKEKVSDPFDISLTPKFIQKYEWAKLKKEYNDKGNVRLLNELEYERVVNEFDIDLEIGMFHDFSFRMNLPIIISDQQSYQFDTSSDDPKYHISPANSTLAPAQTSASRPYKFFELESGQNLKGKDRSGLGDMSFGIAWSPYNTERHFIPERPWERNTGRSTITLAFDYVAPTGDAKTIDNTGAGSGVHELIFSVKIKNVDVRNCVGRDHRLLVGKIAKLCGCTVYFVLQNLFGAVKFFVACYCKAGTKNTMEEPCIFVRNPEVTAVCVDVRTPTVYDQPSSVFCRSIT